MKSIANHRIPIRNPVDTDISIVSKKEFSVNFQYHGMQRTTNLTLYFGVAGYKNEIMIGTDYQYMMGGMLEFRYQSDIWYILSTDNIKGRILLYLEVDEDKNLWGYFGKDLPMDFSKEDRTVSSKHLLLTPIEMKLLVRELKKDREEYLNEFKIEYDREFCGAGI